MIHKTGEAIPLIKMQVIQGNLSSTLEKNSGQKITDIKAELDRIKLWAKVTNDAFQTKPLHFNPGANKENLPITVLALKQYMEENKDKGIEIKFEGAAADLAKKSTDELSKMISPKEEPEKPRRNRPNQ